MIFYDTRTDAGGLSVEQPTPTKVSGSPLCLDHPVSYFGTSAFLEMK